jgi:excisionase family DNA binding protein
MIEEVSIRNPHQPMPITVRVPEACRLTGIGRSKLYELIAAGDIKVIKVGSITLIPVADLARYLNGLLSK